MSARHSNALTRPTAIKVIFIQVIAVLLASAIAWFFSPLQGCSVLLGGSIAVLGQAFYNHRALRHFGSQHSGEVVSATFSAMWGKWFIVIAASLIAVIKIEELHAGSLYFSLFLVHTLGALLLPVLVKRVA